MRSQLITREYSANPDVTIRQLENCGFKERKRYWLLRKYLYGDYVYLEVILYKTGEIRDSVLADREFYAPFYNIEWSRNNQIAEKSRKEYIKIMNSLERNGIIIFE